MAISMNERRIDWEFIRKQIYYAVLYVGGHNYLTTKDDQL